MADETKKEKETTAQGAGIDKAAQKIIDAHLAEIGSQKELIKSLNAKLKNSQMLNDDQLRVFNEKNAEVARLSEELLKSADVISSLNKDVDILKSELTNLSEELGSAQDAAEKGYLTVKSGKKSFRVLGKKFSYKGQDHTAEDLTKNQKLIDELVEIGAGFLLEVKEGKEKK